MKRTRSVLRQMMCLVPMAFAGCAYHATHRPAPVPSPVPGEMATIPENMLVSVKNPDPLETRRGEFVYGDQCLIVEGERVTLVAVHGGRALVRHESPKEKFYGMCPTGILFFVTTEEFATMTERYESNKVRNAAERELVRTLLREAAPAP